MIPMIALEDIENIISTRTSGKERQHASCSVLALVCAGFRHRRNDGTLSVIHILGRCSVVLSLVAFLVKVIIYYRV